MNLTKKLLFIASFLLVIGLIGCILTKKTSNFSFSNIQIFGLSSDLNQEPYSTVDE